MSIPQPPKYIGNCHCGRYRFRVSVADPIIPIACTCSLCTKKGYLWLAAAGNAFEVVRDDGRLARYRSAVLEDEFCSHCGTGVLGRHLAGPLAGELLVNIRAVQGPNPFELESKIRVARTEDTRTFRSPPSGSTRQDPPKHTGSCHCGKVWVELLTELRSREIKEDNCSLCVRNAYIGVYPAKDEVRIHGRENTFEYRCGRGFVGTPHCGACGVTVFTNVYGPPLSVFDSVPPERKEAVMAAYRRNMNLQPLNVRALDGVSLGELEVERSDEGTAGYVLSD